MMRSIKSLRLKNRYFLAPMAEVNDIAFRLLCKKAGTGLTYTGMINPLSKEKLILDDKPALQLFSNSSKGIKKFIKRNDKKVSLWDFNLGCPSRKAKLSGIGAYLKDLEIIEKILKTIRDSTKKPVTVKIRKSELAFDILKIAEKYCDALCVHPRTLKQGYSGTPDIKFAKKIKKLSKIPIIYSGNTNEKNANSLLKEFDYVMVGREAIGNPEIFSKLTGKQVKKKISFKDYLELAEKYKIKFSQMKKQALYFTKGIKGAKAFRNKIFKIKKFDELKSINF